MHVEKYNKKQTAILLKHYSRDHFYYKNENIDTKKSNLNYNLSDIKRSKDFLGKRLEEVKIQKRDDVITMCDWIITLPKNIKNQDNERIFFEEAYNFFVERYGKENTISAWVHKDETQPHLHFCFIPVVYEKKKERYKVCAKEVITRKELKKIHSDMQKYLDEKLSFKTEILTEGKSKSYNKVEEMRLDKELENIKNMNKTLKAKELAETATLIKNDRSIVGFFTQALEAVKSNKIVRNNIDKNKAR